MLHSVHLNFVRWFNIRFSVMFLSIVLCMCIHITSKACTSMLAMAVCCTKLILKYYIVEYRLNLSLVAC